MTSLLLAALNGCAAGDGPDPGREPSIDATSLYNSVAVDFLPRYRRVMGNKAKLTRSGGTFCDDTAGAFTCEVEVDRTDS